MKNNDDLISSGRLFKKSKRALDKVNGNSLLRANIRHIFAATALIGLIGWQIGFNVWVVLIFVFLMSLLFFGEITTTRAFRLELAGVIIILVAGLSYNIFIERPGMSHSLFSYVKDKVLKNDVDLENPAIDLQGKAYDLVRKKAEELRKRDSGNFPKLIEDAEYIQRMKDSVYNSLHTKAMPVVASSQNIGQEPQPAKQIIDINQFGKQRGDTTYYKFTLQPGQKTSSISLEDNRGRYGWQMVYDDNDIVVEAGGQRQLWRLGQNNTPSWQPSIALAGTNNGPVKVKLKVYLYNARVAEPFPGPVQPQPRPLAPKKSNSVLT
jgi:hypothetical protein